MTEKQLQDMVLEAAGALGIMAYHTHDSRRSQAGFPDLVLVGPRGVEFWELKSSKGRVSDDQRRWVDALNEAGVYAGVMRPMDWDMMMRRLLRLAGKSGT